MRLVLALLFCLLGPIAAPAQTSDVLTRVAFGSCVDEEVSPQPIWDAVRAYKPDLFIFAGDNVYGDLRGGSWVPDKDLMASLEEAYETVKKVDGYMEMKRGRHLAIWDDHDYGKNDAGEEFPHKAKAKELFLKFWEIPSSDPRHTRQGLYHAQTFGPEGKRVQVILLDTRSFRSRLKRRTGAPPPGHGRYVPDNDPAKTMLGSEQWAWLEQTLREPAELRLVVSTIQVLAGNHGWERWGTFPREQRRLFDLIRNTGAKGVVLLSGDRHIGGMYHTMRGTPYPLTELTSSGLTQSFAGAEKIGPQIGQVYGKVNFGTVDIDWDKKLVVLSLRSENGDVQRSIGVHFDELR